MSALAMLLLLAGAPVSLASPVFSLPHRMVPPRESSPGKPPLLVLLHGYGADENDLVSLGAALDPRLLVVCPRGTMTAPRRGFKWYGEDSDSDAEPKVGLEASQQAILRFVEEAVAAYDADPRRVYLGGFSQGAVMSLRVALAAPEKIAGALVLSGYLLDDPHRTEAKPRAMHDLPLFVSHGRSDDVIPIERARATRDHLQTLPVRLTYREFDGRHQIRVALGTWMAEQLNGKTGAH